MFRTVRYFYEQNQTYYYLDEATGEFGSVLANQKDPSYNYFHLFKDDEPSNEGLLAFKEKFRKCANELNKKGGIVYNKYYNHYSATELTFKRYSPKAFSAEFPQVNFNEFEFIEKCYNGGIIYFDEQYKDKPTASFGYDYSSFYPNILNSEEMMIPRSTGTKMKLTNLDFENLKFGIYNVKITCANPEFRKLFCFSRKHYYTHYSIAFANKYKTLFDVNIELIVSQEFNAIIYEDLVPSKVIFGNWFDKLYNQLKPKCKGNFLLKRLLSSIWGSLTKMEKWYLAEEHVLSELEEGEYVLINERHRLENGEIITHYEAIRKSKPYKYHFGRIKPFLLSLSRNTIGELIINAGVIDNVLRVHTDGLVLNKPYEFENLGISYYPMPEEKTTGLIDWKNVNCYHRIPE